MAKRRTRKIFWLWRKILKKWYISFLLLTVLVLVTGYFVETQIRESYSFGGIPRTEGWKFQYWSHTLRNKGFMLGYSEWRKNPLWVVYRLKQVKKEQYLKRPGNFTKDPRIFSSVDPDNYRKSGYDRGHMAPNHAISSLYGKEAQKHTFMLSNIVPQRPKLNRILWQRFEEMEYTWLRKWFENVWVFTGPVFDKEIASLASGIEIPDQFFRIYVRQNTDSAEIKILAFLVPQKVYGNEPLTRFICTVDKIEKLTGLDFFHELEPGLENRLEASKMTKAWNIEKVARLPGRYAKYQKRKQQKKR